MKCIHIYNEVHITQYKEQINAEVPRPSQCVTIRGAVSFLLLLIALHV